jgi:hypothetical protein
LIRVQCTKKSTRVPVSPVPQYGYSGQKSSFITVALCELN